MVAPEGETVDAGQLGVVVHGGDEGGEEIGLRGWEFVSEMLQDVFRLPLPGDAAVTGQLRMPQQCAELARLLRATEARLDHMSQD